MGAPVYCASVWSSTSQRNLKRLINLQKRVIRIVSRSSFGVHANPILVSLRILTFGDIIKLQIGRVMYLYRNGFLPKRINDMFWLNCDVHSYNTRSKNSFLLPYCRTNVTKFSLRFQGPKIFNSLSSEIHNVSSTALFNSKLKSFFLDKDTLYISLLVCNFSLLAHFFLVYSCIIFSHLSYLVFALTRSAFSIFILFND